MILLESLVEVHTMWTTAKLQSIQVPEDKTKVTMTDPETRGLVYEVRPAGRSFYLRYTF